jgi:hypothetical protein
MDNFFRREIKTTYHHAVKASLLWKIIIDFRHYPIWNNFILEVHGEAVTATRIKFKFQLPRGIMLPATAIILAVESENEIRWKGGLPIPGLFSAEHYYIFNSNGNGQTDMHHGEIFRGLLVPLIWPLLRIKGTPVYEQNNIDLDKRAKQLVQESGEI